MASTQDPPLPYLPVLSAMHHRLNERLDIHPAAPAIVTIQDLPILDRPSIICRAMHQLSERLDIPPPILPMASIWPDPARRQTNMRKIQRHRNEPL